ncbi:MAG: methionyl-tRNA formyltransferase [Desulfovibrionaceae bacterium]|nr:methionyl-tRNA formyltransferase [Desulfovibrionaceae bacterium]
MSEAREKLNLVFMGTPDFAATVLRRLAVWDGGRVTAAYCQPDRPAGRGHKLTPPPVKLLAGELNVPVFQPRNFREEADRRVLAELRPDVLVVAAYGLILPQAVLDIPRLGPVNVHGSLLPRYRGAAPVQRAVMDGEKETGVAIMRMEAGLDTGPVYAARRVPVGRHTAGTLHDVLAEEGSDLLIAVLSQLRDGTAVATPQDDALATYAAKMTGADGVIDWDRQAEQIDAHIRGVTPWPGAQTWLLLPEKEIFRVILGPGVIGPEKPLSVPSGALWVLEGGKPAIAARDRFYILENLRPANRKAMTGRAFVNGYLPRGAGEFCGRALPRPEV